MNFVFDIDDTITRYEPMYFELAEKGLAPHFSELVRLGVSHGLDPAEARRRIFDHTETQVRWDYGELFLLLGIPFDEGDSAMTEFHRKCFGVHEDTVKLIREFAERGIPMYIASNNPTLGCVWKLRRAGLDPRIFRRIFSTDFTGSCKKIDGVWNFIAARLGVPPGTAFTVGDDPFEDAVLPIRAGLGGAFVLMRDPARKYATDTPEKVRFVPDASAILEVLA